MKHQPVDPELADLRVVMALFVIGIPVGWTVLQMLLAMVSIWLN